MAPVSKLAVLATEGLLGLRLTSPKSVNLSQALKVLELSNVKFRINEKMFQKGSNEKLLQLTGFKAETDIKKYLYDLAKFEKLII